MTPTDELDRQLARGWTRELTQDGDVIAARVVELDGCFSEGSTLEEALTNLDNALKLWLGAAIESGIPIPEPLSFNQYTQSLASMKPLRDE